MMLTWDLQGDRRWIPVVSVAEPVTNGADTTGSFADRRGDGLHHATPTLVQFLDLATGARRARSSTPVTEQRRVWDWRPDGRRFATAGADGFVRVWDWRTGEVVTERSRGAG